MMRAPAETFSSSLSQFRSQLGSIPLVLRLAVLLGIIGSVALPLLPLLPGVGFTISGTYLTWAEVWRTGVAYALLLGGPLYLAIPYGVLQRKAWVRPMLVVFPILQLIPFELAHVFGDAPNPTPGGLHELALPMTIWALGFGSYLFASRSVRYYFQGQGSYEGKVTEVS